jgi:hypothetical protein
MFKATKTKQCFKPAYSFECEVVEELPPDEFGQVAPKKKPSKYLPGERLLKSIAKKKEQTPQLDIERITASLSKILNGL